jgi:hypothetical protein
MAAENNIIYKVLNITMYTELRYHDSYCLLFRISVLSQVPNGISHSFVEMPNPALYSMLAIEYHIVGKFCGVQFSRMAGLQSFRGLIFADASDRFMPIYLYTVQSYLFHRSNFRG